MAKTEFPTYDEGNRRRAATGIAALVEITHGGLPRRQTTLVEGIAPPERADVSHLELGFMHHFRRKLRARRAAKATLTKLEKARAVDLARSATHLRKLRWVDQQ